MPGALITGDGPPPPSRRALRAPGAVGPVLRTTSAFAESSPTSRTRSTATADHLRLRGELVDADEAAEQHDGPPPPSRRALQGLDVDPRQARTTSAFAESSTGPAVRRRRYPDHLRLRGELSSSGRCGIPINGPPPPSRRALGARDRQQPGDWTTSAFAESSRPPRWSRRSAPDHLRLRGELVPSPFAEYGGAGPPPPSRRALYRHPGYPGRGRTTSAFAESSEPGRRS